LFFSILGRKGESFEEAKYKNKIQNQQELRLIWRLFSRIVSFYFFGTLSRFSNDFQDMKSDFPHEL